MDPTDRVITDNYCICWLTTDNISEVLTGVAPERANGNTYVGYETQLMATL